MILNKSKFAIAYERKRRKFASELAKQVEKDILSEEHKQKIKRITDDEIRKKIKKGSKPTAYDLQNRFGIGKDRAYRILRSLSVA